MSKSQIQLKIYILGIFKFQKKVIIIPWTTTIEFKIQWSQLVVRYVNNNLNKKVLQKHIYYYDPNGKSSTEIKEILKKITLYNSNIDIWKDVKTTPLLENESGPRICFAMTGYSNSGNWTTNEQYPSKDLQDKSIKHVECSLLYNEIMPI